MKIVRNLIKIFIILLLLELFIFFIEVEQQGTDIANEPQEIMLTEEIKEEIEETEENEVQPKINNENEIVTEIQKPTKQYEKEDIITEYKGYTVSSKLTIPTISLETYILQNYSVNALRVSVTKFWGVDANQIGNFCIAGHNFKNKNMFSNLKKLNIGDRLFVIGAMESDKYLVKPIELFVIAAPKDRVAATMIMLGQDTPFTIDSLILINGFFSYFKIDRMIIPSRGGIAVPKPSIHSKNLISIRLGNTHRAMTRTNVAKTIFSPLVAGGISFFILSNSFDCKSIPFVLGFIRKRKTNIIAAKISNPTGIANIIYCP